MKHVLNVLLALSVISIFLISPVAAATSQGLEWGFVVGDKWNFTMKESTGTLDEQIFMNITQMPAQAIPDPVTQWSDIPYPNIGIYWANGTDIGMVSFVFLGLLAIGSKFAVPIGNFSLLTDLVSVELTGEQIIDNANEWGIEYTHSINSTHDSRLTGTYSKVDGFLAQYKWEIIVSQTSEVAESFTVIRNNLPSGGFDFNSITQLLQDNILYVGAGVGVLIILAIVCKKR